MEIITREITRTRNDRVVKHFYKTYDIVFLKDKKLDGGNFRQLLLHLQDAFVYGLRDREKSPSSEGELVVKLKALKNHQFSKLAHASDYYGSSRRQHQMVQDYFLYHHPDCIATELPVWNSEWSGLIDIVLYNRKAGRIAILDFKPDASKERSVSGQLYRYAKLLSECTGIPMSDIDTFYFDGKNTYQVTF